MTTTAAPRQESGRLVARRLAQAIGEIAPPELGHWPPAWEIVEVPSREFLDALAEWEENGTAEHKEAVRRAADRVLQAWRQAAVEWEARAD